MMDLSRLIMPALAVIIAIIVAALAYAWAYFTNGHPMMLRNLLIVEGIGILIVFLFELYASGKIGMGWLYARLFHYS